MTMADEFASTVKPYVDGEQWDKVTDVIEQWNNEGKITLPEYADILTYEPLADGYVKVVGVTNQNTADPTCIEIEEDELGEAYDLVLDDVVAHGIDAEIGDNVDPEGDGMYGQIVPTSKAQVDFLANSNGHTVKISGEEAIELCGEELEGQNYIYYTTDIEWYDLDRLVFADGSVADGYGRTEFLF